MFKNLKFTQYLLLSLWIFTVPTNLFWKILPNFGFVGGLQIDYLIPKIYLIDLVGVAMIGVWLLEKVISEKLKVERTDDSLGPYHLQLITYTLLSCCLLLFARQLFTPIPIAAVWFFVSSLIHVATFLVALSWMKENRSPFSKKIMIGALAFTVLFQSVLGIFQFVNQRQFIGFLFFGESQLTRDLGLSKGNFAGLDQVVGSHLGLRILPYGTTPHPNVLAGFLAISLLVLMRFWRRGSTKLIESVFIGASIATGLMILLLTLSLSAWLVFAIGLMIVVLEKQFKNLKLKIKNVHYLLLATCYLLLLFLVPVAIHVLNDFTHHASPSLFRRDFLNQQAMSMLKKKPWFGVGMNQFTVEIAQSSQNQLETVAFVQPAHHLPLLFVTENGLFGVVILFLFYKVFVVQFSSSAWRYFLILTPLITLDHYLYSLTPGQMMFGLGWIFLITQFEQNKNV